VTDTDNRVEGALSDLVSLPKPPALGYQEGARSFCAGFVALAHGSSLEREASIFLAGFAVECALKSFIAKGKTKAIYEHDLVRLWKKAIDLGLSISASPPDWCIVLSGLSTRPQFDIRYHSAHAGQTPDLPAMLIDIPDLVAKTEAAL
jgi:hypothetical protein